MVATPPSSLAAPSLVNRSDESRILRRLLQDVQDGQSQSLVLSGDPGVGKTALLQFAVGIATGFRLMRATGVESEMELPFAGLHQFCTPLLNRLDSIPAPQKGALRTAFGLLAGKPPDRFLVGLGILSLLSEIAEEQPLLCVIDDAQWMDQASIQCLAFAARRLLAEHVGFLFVTRDRTDVLSGLNELHVGTLHESDSRTLLASVIRTPVDPRVLDRIVFETAGNPLAILEWPRGMEPGDLAGGFGLPAPASVSDRIDEQYRRRLRELPPRSRRILTLAAAEPTGDPMLLWRAAGRLGLDASDMSPAIDAGLLEVGNRVLFRHPSVRSATYRSVSTDLRTEAHRALAEVTDPVADPDRRAWHRALATIGPDEEVAAELERSAGRARARGGLSAEAALLQRSANLTLDIDLKVTRSLAAVEAHLEAGDSRGCAAALESVRVLPLSKPGRAHLEILQGYFSASWGDYREAVRSIVGAAQRFEEIDISVARATYVMAINIGVGLGQFGGNEFRETARAALAASSLNDDEPATLMDLLCVGLASTVVEGVEAAVPSLKQAIVVGRTIVLTPEEGVRRYGFLCGATTLVWDYDAFQFFAQRAMEVTKESGALNFLPVALNLCALVEIHAGNLASAQALVDEASAINEVTESKLGMYAVVPLACMRGREVEARSAIETAIVDAEETFQGLLVKIAQAWAALMCNALGRYDEALNFARLSCADPISFGIYQVLPELVEAAVRSGQLDAARQGLLRLVESTRASGTDWAVGVEARTRALLRTGEEAEALYVESIRRFANTPLQFDEARTHLLYGEWLRREGRRVDARSHLHTAFDALREMGLEAFAERARVELEATGEKVRKRSPETRFTLTPQEAQIARLASAGQTNPEIGARLFLSPRTVEYHLGKVFMKLGVKSRRQLPEALQRVERALATA